VFAQLLGVTIRKDGQGEGARTLHEPFRKVGAGRC